MKRFLVFATFSFLLASCGFTNNKSGPGFLYTDTVDAISFDNSVSKPNKVGRACSTRVLSLLASGDASIESAKRNGYITKIASADTEYFNILGLYGKACTVVRGE